MSLRQPIRINVRAMALVQHLEEFNVGFLGFSGSVVGIHLWCNASLGKNVAPRPLGIMSMEYVQFSAILCTFRQVKKKMIKFSFKLSRCNY